MRHLFNLIDLYKIYVHTQLLKQNIRKHMYNFFITNKSEDSPKTTIQDF